MLQRCNSFSSFVIGHLPDAKKWQKDVFHFGNMLTAGLFNICIFWLLRKAGRAGPATQKKTKNVRIQQVTGKLKEIKILA